MPELLLNGGHTMLFDDVDREIALRYRWQVGPPGYAHRIGQTAGKRVHISFHRLITNAPLGMQVDHINGNRLDNRRSNLRIVTAYENAQNLHGARADSRTGLRGVERRRNGRFHARIWVDGRTVSLGSFATSDEAAVAARAGRLRFFKGALS